MQRRTYAAYWDLLTPAQYTARLAEVAAEKSRLQKLEAASLAYVPAGDPDQLANRIIELLGAEDVRRSMSEEGPRLIGGDSASRCKAAFIKTDSPNWSESADETSDSRLFHDRSTHARRH